MTRYRLAEPIPQSIKDVLSEHSPLVSQLLFSRGLVTKESVSAFMSPNFENERHDPFLMTDMENAVARILKAMSDNSHIAIWSDYDCDGIPGAVVLHDLFKFCGFTNFENYIPHRHDEGFGLNTEGIDALASCGTTLLISIDCGISNVREVAHANTHGIDVIVTDHHEPGVTLPPAYAILNPKRDYSYPFRELCGTGVIWKLIEGLLLRGNFTLKEGQEKWLLDMVGLATLADMVPLVGENRLLAHYGLIVLRKSKRAGVRELCSLMRLDQRMLTEDDVGFSIAPRINAASRMGSPHQAFNLFTSADDTALGYAKDLERVNNERKGVVGALVRDIKKRMNERSTTRSVIVMGSPEWRPSLLGLAANSLVSEYKRPVFLWGRDGRGLLKGSCRSDGSRSVVALMQGATDFFIEFGGHHMSGGFSVKEDYIHTLEEKLSLVSDATIDVPLSLDTISIDADLSLADVSARTVRDIRALAPFGVGNQKPLFRFMGVTPSRIMQFGKTKEHLKVMLSGERHTVEAIAFFSTPDSFGRELRVGETCDVIGHIESSYFRSRHDIRLRIVAVV